MSGNGQATPFAFTSRSKVGSKTPNPWGAASGAAGGPTPSNQLAAFKDMFSEDKVRWRPSSQSCSLAEVDLSFQNPQRGRASGSAPLASGPDQSRPTSRVPSDVDELMDHDDPLTHLRVSLIFAYGELY
jgi:hypothetical protein